MVQKILKDSINISRLTLLREKGIVILPLKDYKEFLKYELEKEYIDKIVEEGLKEEKNGKTETIDKFLKREYSKLYAAYKH